MINAIFVHRIINWAYLTRIKLFIKVIVDLFNVLKLGDNVRILIGAKVLGSINIGVNVVIGANVVFIRYVPENAVVAGVPTKIIKYRSNAE